MLLLHGFLEHAHVWDFVAPHLAEAGHHVYALDWRGHGDSEWIGAGGYYHFIDYVADLAELVRALGGRAALVAHSMGGGAAVLFAGTEPQRVSALVTIEGLGAPDLAADAAPDRVHNWLRDLERSARRKSASMSLEAAVARFRERHPHFSEALARHMVVHATREVANQRVWKFDPLHQTQAPLPMPAARARAFWRRVGCPVLYIEGAQSFLRLSAIDVNERLAALRATRVTIAGAAHHPHLEQPETTARQIIEFLRGA